MSYPPPEYRRRCYRLYRAWMRDALPTTVYAWLLVTLREQRHTWRWN